MNKNQMTAGELAVKKEAEEKRAKELKEKKAARRVAIKSKIDLLGKTDKNTVTKEAGEILDSLKETVGEALSDAIENMEIDELADEVQSMAGDVNTIVSSIEKIEEMLDEADIKSIKTVKAGLQEMQVKLLKIASQTEKNGNGSGNGNTRKSLRDFVSEKADDLAKFQSTQGGSVNIAVKMNRKDGPAFVGTTTHVNPQPNAYLPAPTVQEGVIAIVHPRNRILEFVRMQSIATSSLVVINEVSGEGDFQWTAEGALKPFVDFEFKTENVSAEKVAAFSKVSREALTDISFMQAETERIISDKYERKLSSEVFNGDGTLKAGATDKSIFGIAHYAPGYVQTCLNGKIDRPELSEVLFASATQIRNLGFDGPLVAFVNPCDWAAEKMRKTVDGELLEVDKLLEGITVVPTVEVNPDEFMVGDLSVYTLYVYEDFSINYGYENDDFRRNLVSLVAESRVYGFVPENHKGALVKDTIGNVKQLIEKI